MASIMRVSQTRVKIEYYEWEQERVLKMDYYTCIIFNYGIKSLFYGRKTLLSKKDWAMIAPNDSEKIWIVRKVTVCDHKNITRLRVRLILKIDKKLRMIELRDKKNSKRNCNSRVYVKCFEQNTNNTNLM